MVTVNNNENTNLTYYSSFCPLALAIRGHISEQTQLLDFGYILGTRRPDKLLGRNNGGQI